MHYVNIRVNAPTVDHIQLLRSPEEVITLMEEAGFIADETLVAPMGGYELERALRQQISISVALTAHPAP